METTQLSSKGQLVLPQRLRKVHGWRPGTVFTVKEVPEGVLLAPVARPPVFSPTRVEDVFGIGRRKGRRLSLQDMDAAVRSEATRHK